MPPARAMSLTSEMVALCFREEPDLGFDERWTRMTDEDYRAMAVRLNEQSGGGPIWVFAYGSLIWKPEFDAVESERATAFGWHRAFTLEIDSWRGSKGQPGLMMALQRGGRCDGVVYRLPDGDRVAQIERMLRREVSEVEGSRAVRWMPVRSQSGRVEKALSFWVGTTHRNVARPYPLEDVANILARACGHVGSGAEYLFNTVSHLEDLGIHDRNLWRLQELVAAEISAMHGLDVPVAVKIKAERIREKTS